jgi:hypothetical protein
MGQEIVYCFKCQKRILGSDYAKGQAFDLENNSCCSACAVQVLDTLPPKAKEQLLARMFKATQSHQPPPAPSKGGGGGPRASTGRIPIVAGPSVPPRSPASEPSRSAALAVVGAVAVVLVVGLFIMFASTPSPSEAPKRSEATKPAPLPRPAPEPGPSLEEKRRDDSAKEAMRKARAFAAAHPLDADGQAREWKEALHQAEGTGYEVDLRREVAKSEARAQEDCAQAIEDLGRRIKGLKDRKQFKAAQDQLARDQSLRPSPEWGSAVDRLRGDIRASAAAAFEEEKTKAVRAKARGAESEVAAAKAEVARWGFPELVAELETALTPEWLPLFDGRSLAGFPSVIANAWRVEDGALVHDNDIDNAATMTLPAGDGDLRMRFDIRRVAKVWLSFRLSQKGYYQFFVQGRAIESLEGREHELILSSRGDSASATLDGNAASLETVGHPKDGMLQFNSSKGCFRIKSLEYRPAK